MREKGAKGAAEPGATDTARPDGTVAASATCVNGTPATSGTLLVPATAYTCPPSLNHTVILGNIISK